MTPFFIFFYDCDKIFTDFPLYAVTFHKNSQNKVSRKKCALNNYKCDGSLFEGKLYANNDFISAFQT